MKVCFKVIFAIYLSSMFILSAQSKDSPQIQYKPLSVYNNVSFLSHTTTTNYIDLKINLLEFNTKNYLAVYNNFSDMYTIFSASKDSYRNLSERTIPLHNFRPTRRNSFNPYGATDFTGGVLLGSFGILLNKLQE